MVKCECGRVWYYDDVAYEWKIEKESDPKGLDKKFEPTVTKMSGGGLNYEYTELTIYQCPCGKINGVVATSGIQLDNYGIFMHPDWDNEDIDADI